MKKLLAVFLSLHLILSPVAMAGAGTYANQILGISSSIVGATVLTKCKLATTQPSMMVYMAGGLAYVGKEVLGAKDQAAFHEDKSAQIKELQDQSNLPGYEGQGDIQKEALTTLLEDEKKNKEMIESRKKWMMAITAIYGTATGLAIAEQLGVFLLKPDTAGCSGGYDATTGKVAGFVISAYASQVAAAGGGGGAGGGGIIGMGAGLAQNALQEKFSSSLYPAVTAGSNAVAGLNLASVRIGVFGASTVLSGLVTKDLSDQSGLADENIKKIEKVLASLKGESAGGSTSGSHDTNGATSGATSGGGDSTGGNKNGNNNDPADKSYALKALAKGKPIDTHCWSSSLDYSPAACNGNKIKLSPPTLHQFGGKLPSALLEGMKASLDMGQALANGDNAKANLAAGSLAAMAGRINDAKNEMAKQLNDKLIAKGEKPIDFDKKVNDQIATMMASLPASANGGAANTASAGTNSNSGGATLSATPDKASSSNMPAVSSTSGVGDVAPGDSGLNLEMPAGEAPADPNIASSENLGQSLDKYESSVQDISKERDVSIFKQVSNRYLLNYSKIFTKKTIKDDD